MSFDPSPLISPFYLISTPLGNVQDISLRALAFFRRADFIACESKAPLQALLRAHQVEFPRLLIVHSHNEKAGASGILSLLKRGLVGGYASDAGSPGISDPGARLVRELSQSGASISALPGPSAGVMLITLSGYSGPYLFQGFLPRKQKAAKRIKALLSLGVPFVFYESPLRLESVLKEIANCDLTATLCVGRELTKAHEEILHWESAKNGLAYIEKNGILKGEIAVFCCPSVRALK